MNNLEATIANLTALMAQQVTNSAAREEAEALRTAAREQAEAQRATAATQLQADENARRAAQEERELVAAQTKGLNDFKRQDPPKFAGGFDPEVADSWLQELEKIFAFLHTAEATKVDYAAYLLTGEAEYWWRGAKAMMEADGRAITWVVFRRAFLDKYFPASVKMVKEEEFLRLRQGSMSVAEYAVKLEALAKHFRFFHDQMDEDYMCGRFTLGLNYELQRAVRLTSIHRYQELVEKAKSIEAIDNLRSRPAFRPNQGSGGPNRSAPGRFDRNKSFQKKPFQRPQNRGTSSGYSHSFGNFVPRPTQSDTSEIVCHRCSKKGHFANRCPDLVCWNCQKTGHSGKDCTNPKVEAATNAIAARRPAPAANKGKRPVASARVYTVSGAESSRADGLIRSVGSVNGKPLTILFDSGATHSFIDLACALRLELKLTELPFDLVTKSLLQT
ncbi:uncharacterized protein LOC130725517 [Lotus japonicus]|uniref:uncharacterized protein LOC130725517 n=1 Tax=Lotus japonicus TaxID=34305 RepID=UPI002582CB63|nr:uncharacterized protein LOC130725517 [Lotus japonicus]